MTPFDASTPLVCDGGLATELEARGHDLTDALWSARLLLDAPGEIVAAHRAFFEAGAAVATTASYQASLDGFARRGLGRAQFAALLHRSVTLARQAAAEAPGEGRHRFVAASVGPYGAALADGAEYRGRYGLTTRQLRDWHRPRLDILAEAAPDVLALETVPDVDEAEALVEAVAGLGVPAWLTYSIAGEHTRAGQPLTEAFAVAADSPDVVAIGVNCCAPDDVSGALAHAGAVTDKPLIVYPNSGENWDAARRRWWGPSLFTPERARRWFAEGATVVGGCCRVSPADIAGTADISDVNDPADIAPGAG
ncbi:homocysteine S-methyltransferase [Saccharomonospora piscinae]|uniref:homocysteine S-methyltransferase n=1 Tax=Saccharomonospora piscinae TaxID=687388 RepID=UPI001106E4C0|nr:homocysteine S-methyltransferase [Saccharomonospora piscinae]TLW93141.1 homocysteine S-methyltransferase [Saccharomonospora piscinae]